jgi:hypothetical protein
VTVADWIKRRATDVPATLVADVIAALGQDARLDAADAPRACLAAAARLLRGLLDERAFGRDSAGRLLAADALTTYAFERAAEAGMKASDLSVLASSAVQQMSFLATTP